MDKQNEIEQLIVEYGQAIKAAKDWSEIADRYEDDYARGKAWRFSQTAAGIQAKIVKLSTDGQW